ncbi:MAG: hypothetical protein PHS82_13275 [Lachnospiraceae bacterium]|nr:hypothetical protein [Lachnospiraceae bacterium]
MEARGKNFLKVTGIIMIVFGAIGALSTLISFAGLSVLMQTYAALGMDTSMIVPGLIISAIGGVLQLAAGIIGVVHARKPEKAMLCIIFGVLLVILQIVSGVTSLLVVNAQGSSIVTTIISMIIGLILPVLFIYGGILNKQS